MNNYYIVFNLYLNCCFSIPFPFYGQNMIEKFKSLDSSFFYVILFILFLAVLGGFLLHRLFSSCGEQGLLCNCRAWASHPSGFSCCGARALGCMGFSSCGSQILEHGLHCSAECGGLHGSGIKPVSLALADGLFTTEPPGKPWKVLTLGCTS